MWAADSELQLRVGNGSADVIRSVGSDELSSSLCFREAVLEARYLLRRAAGGPEDSRVGERSLCRGVCRCRSGLRVWHLASSGIPWMLDACVQKGPLMGRHAHSVGTEHTTRAPSDTPWQGTHRTYLIAIRDHGSLKFWDPTVHCKSSVALEEQKGQQDGRLIGIEKVEVDLNLT